MPSKSPRPAQPAPHRGPQTQPRPSAPVAEAVDGAAVRREAGADGADAGHRLEEIVAREGHRAHRTASRSR